MAAEKKKSEDVEIQEIVDRLSAKYPALTRERVASVVTEVHLSMKDAKVRDFVPVLVERGAKERLKPEAKALAAGKKSPS